MVSHVGNTIISKLLEQTSSFIIQIKSGHKTEDIFISDISTTSKWLILMYKLNTYCKRIWLTIHVFQYEHVELCLEIFDPL